LPLDAHPIWINRERFSHRKLAQAAVERILNRFKPGAKLDDEAFTFVEDLCRFHPWALSRGPIWDIWVIPGCKERPESCVVRGWDRGFDGYDRSENGRKIPVWRPPFWACFLAVTSRGEKFCFNYRDALYQIPGIKELTEACRYAVYEEIKARKSSLMDAKGAVSGIFHCHHCPPEKAWSWDDIHMDHVPPLTMAQLIWNWLAEEGKYVDEIPLCPKTGRWKFAIDKLELLKGWREYQDRKSVV